MSTSDNNYDFGQLRSNVNDEDNTDISFRPDSLLRELGLPAIDDFSQANYDPLNGLNNIQDPQILFVSLIHICFVC